MSKTGYIYKLCCNNPEITDCYVGSTKNEKVRKNNHKKCCNNPNQTNHNLNVYQFIRANEGWDNWSMIRLEEFKFNERAELNARERYWLEELQATLNKVIPTRTPKEYYESNKEVLNQINRAYHKANKEVIAAQKKVYYESNKKVFAEKGKIYRDANKEKIKQRSVEYYKKNNEVIQKKSKDYYKNNREEQLLKSNEYRKANKDVINQKQNERYQKNKQQIAEKMKEKITCDCGTTYRKCTKARHEKSQKHKNYITASVL